MRMQAVGKRFLSSAHGTREMPHDVNYMVSLSDPFHASPLSVASRTPLSALWAVIGFQRVPQLRQSNTGLFPNIQDDARAEQSRRGWKLRVRIVEIILLFPAGVLLAQARYSENERQNAKC